MITQTQIRKKRKVKNTGERNETLKITGNNRKKTETQNNITTKRKKEKLKC